MRINNPPAASQTVTPRGTGSGKGKKALTVALSLLAASLLLFGGGFFVGRSGLDAAKADLAKNRAESKRLMAQSQGETQSVQTRLTAEQARLRVADARNLLYKSAVEIDRRNFGTAQTNVKQASDILESGAMEEAGFAAGQSQAVKDALRSINLSVADNSETQRAQLLKAAEQMDTLFDALPKPESEPAPTNPPAETPQEN